MFTLHYIYMCYNYNTQGQARYNNVYITLYLNVFHEFGTVEPERHKLFYQSEI